MSEDERQEMVRTIAEAHSGLEIAFKLRRELTSKAPALKAAIKAEQEAFRLKRELQRSNEDFRCPRRSDSLTRGPQRSLSKSWSYRSITC